MRTTLDTIPDDEGQPVDGRAPARVLLAEDDDAMRELVAGALKGDGYHVIEAVDGHDLAARLSRLVLAEWPGEPIDVIVSDVCMPGFDGLEVLAGLREAGIRTPVVMMTGFPSERTAGRAHRLGATLLAKPFDLDVLRSHVTALARVGAGKVREPG